MRLTATAIRGLLQANDALRARFPDIGLSASALRLGCAEGFLAQALCGLPSADPTATGFTCQRLSGGLVDLLEDLVGVGRMMAVIGDERAQALHLLGDTEIDDHEGELRLDSAALHLRLRSAQVTAVAVTQRTGCPCGGRLGVMLYDASGRPVLRLYRTVECDRALLAEVVATYRADEQDAVQHLLATDEKDQEPVSGEPPAAVSELSPLAAQRLRARWLAATSPDEVDQLLRDSSERGCDRLAVLDHAGPLCVQRLPVEHLAQLIASLAEPSHPCAVIPPLGSASGCILGRFDSAACFDRVHHLNGHEASVRFAHDAVAGLRVVRYPHGAAGMLHGVEAFSATRERLWSVMPGIVLGQPEPAQWSALIARLTAGDALRQGGSLFRPASTS